MKIHNFLLCLFMLQMEGLREAVSAATEEKRTAEEERGHAHEQVLSLIRECNALEEQVHNTMCIKSMKI